MIIQDKKYGKFEVGLGDDGTLDTVIEVYHYAPNGFQLMDNQSKEIRFDTEYASWFRDLDGAMTEQGFEYLAHEAVEAYIEQYLT